MRLIHYTILFFAFIYLVFNIYLIIKIRKTNKILKGGLKNKMPREDLKEEKEFEEKQQEKEKVILVTQEQLTNSKLDELREILLAVYNEIKNNSETSRKE